MSAQLLAIRSAIDYIEQHLQEEITVADIAAAAGYSLYHFIRVFSQVVLHTPYNYLMRRRLSQAALALIQTNERIIDIAINHCFHSPEVFSRAFMRMFGEQPSKYRNRGRIDSHYLFPPRNLSHLEYLQKKPVLPLAYEQRENVQVVGLMTRLGEDQQAIEQLWQTLGSIIAEMKGFDETQSFGIYTYPEDWGEKGAFYMAAVAAPKDEIPLLVTKSLPAGAYACFAHHGPNDTLAYLRAEIYQTWLPKSGNQIPFPMEIEMYTDGIYSPDGSRRICIPIK